MGVKTVRIRMGATVAMGSYENLRPEIEIEAEMSQGEFLDNGIELLLKQALEDLALSMWEPAEAQLKQMNICKDNPEDRFDSAVRGSDFFRWMALLHRDAAESLLADVVDEIENPHGDEDEPLTQEEIDELLESETEPEFDDGNFDDDEDGDDPLAQVEPVDSLP